MHEWRLGVDCSTHTADTRAMLSGLEFKAERCHQLVHKPLSRSIESVATYSKHQLLRHVSRPFLALDA